MHKKWLIDSTTSKSMIDLEWSPPLPFSPCKKLSNEKVMWQTSQCYWALFETSVLFWPRNQSSGKFSLIKIGLNFYLKIQSLNFILPKTGPHFTFFFFRFGPDWACISFFTGRACSEFFSFFFSWVISWQLSFFINREKNS